MKDKQNADWFRRLKNTFIYVLYLNYWDWFKSLAFFSLQLAPVSCMCVFCVYTWLKYKHFIVSWPYPKKTFLVVNKFYLSQLMIIMFCFITYSIVDCTHLRSWLDDTKPIIPKYILQFQFLANEKRVRVPDWTRKAILNCNLCSHLNLLRKWKTRSDFFELSIIF